MTAIGKFGSQAITRQLSRWEFQLLGRLVFVDPVYGLREVPAGFVSDLASIRVLRNVCYWFTVVAILLACLPWLPAWGSLLASAIALGALVLYGVVAGYGMRPAILHDYEYSLGEIPRAGCDAMLYRALHSGDGTAAWRSALFWVGVRMGGSRRYRRPDSF
ncbi:hypothetical protein [Pseudomonas aeruginosa]|uniref:hypothetical protein n=1 Tax=Pseudomonas aeruginosa TaxID=287 RepID=UPI003CC514AF|nr:hypothetical protein [Pseudomonas aeruginosa]